MKIYHRVPIWHLPTLAWRLGLISQYFTYREIFQTLELLKQKTEVESLIDWAERKRVKVDVCQYYKIINQNISHKLALKKRFLGKKFLIAKFFYHFNNGFIV